MDKASYVFIKRAGVINDAAAKFLDYARNKEYMKGIKYVGDELAPPMYLLDKGGVQKGVYEGAHGGMGFFSGILGNIIGESAKTVSEASKNISENKTLAGKIGQGIRNIASIPGKQLRGSQFRIAPDKSEIIQKGGLKYVKGKGLFKNWSFMDRPILGYTSKGNPIINKRLAMRATSPLITTPVGFGALAALGAQGDAKEKAKQGVEESFAWSIPAIGQTMLAGDLISG